MSSNLGSQKLIPSKTDLHLSDEHEGHDDSEDGDGLTENDGDEVLGANARRLHSATENRRTGGEDSPENTRNECKLSRSTKLN